MPLQLPPIKYSELHLLVTEFNLIPEEDGIQRLFYLQKINFLLNKSKLADDLFGWMDQSGPESWESCLLAYVINPDASFFLKGMQFARAVTKQLKERLNPYNSEIDIYELMQARDKLINSTYADSADEYTKISSLLHLIATNDESVKTVISLQSEILEMARVKIGAIKGRKFKEPILPGTAYKTKELGEQGNNLNYILTINGWNKPFVFRIEDRFDFELEQTLHSNAVAKYFILDYAVFREKIKEGNSSQYKPVVLSQFANQGNLEEVARRLKGGPERDIAPITVSYFSRLSDFCNKLIEAGAYHPDIKLGNFLVSDNVLKVADRKTFLNTENPLASKVRSTLFYSPDEYLECMSPRSGTYNQKARVTHINMPQFMAFQLGMALKEFLILTQLDELPNDFSDSTSSAASYFKSPLKQISNLSLLVHELTRSDPKQRMTIKQFHGLLMHQNMSHDNFYNEVEKVLPSSVLGIQNEINEINNLLKTFNNEDLLKQANLLFNNISEDYSEEIRLTRLLEKLAIKCFREESKNYFSQCSEEIETLFITQAWENAPWYRKALYWLSFGFFDVEKVEKLNHSTIKTSFDFDGEEFQSHLKQLKFLPADEFQNELGDTEGTHLYDFIVSRLTENEAKDKVDANPKNENKKTLVDLNSSQRQLKPGTTVFVKGTIQNKNLTTVMLISKETEKSAVKTVLDTSTTAMKTVNYSTQKQINSSNNLARFFNSKSPEQVKVESINEKGMSVKNLIMLGDGKYGSKKGNRPQVKDIIWDGDLHELPNNMV